MKALSGVRITVYERDTTNTVKIYRNHDGTTQGPTVESGATGGPNPFLTGLGGMIEFWCDGPDEIDVKIEDTQAPPRMATRIVGWNSVPAAAGSIPTSMLSGDAALDLDALGPEILRQMTQIGQVIDWWRPQASVPLPSGFEICDGRAIAAGQHDFPGLSQVSINLPDLRNAFILGALPSITAEGTPNKAHGAGAGLGDTVANAPGIAGTGGSMVHRLSGPESGVQVHGHDDSFAVVNQGAFNTGYDFPDHSHAESRPSGAARSAPFGGTTNVAYAGLYDAVQSGGASARHQHEIGAHGHGLNGAVSNAVAKDATNDHNNTPRFVGLLKLMKVRRS